MNTISLRLRHRYYLFRSRRKNVPGVIQAYLQAFTRLDLKRSVAETEFVVFDTETTGLNVSKGDRILSISAVRLKNGRIDLSDSFHEMVNPDRDIPPGTAVIHEILPRMVNGKPLMDEVLPRFIGYIGSSVLVAHHAWLDMSFLNWDMDRLYGFPIQNIVLDTAILDQALTLRKTPSSMRSTVKFDTRLEALAETVPGFHRSTTCFLLGRSSHRTDLPKNDQRSRASGDPSSERPPQDRRFHASKSKCK